MSTPTAPTTTAPLAQKNCHCDLLTWKDPVKTGKVFGTIILTLLVLKTVNLFNIFFHVAYIGLLVSAILEYVGKFVVGEGFVSKYKPATKTYAKKINDEVLPLVAEFNEKFEAEIQKILYAHDIEATLKAAGISYILYKITSLFSLYTLITIVVVLAFTVPAVYVRNKKEIDAAIAQYSKLAKEKTSEYTKLAQDKAAPQLEALAKKTGPVGAIIKNYLPTRTAGSTVGNNRDASFEGSASASSTGASKFPDVPSSNLSSGTQEFVDETKTTIPESF